MTYFNKFYIILFIFAGRVFSQEPVFSFVLYNPQDIVLGAESPKFTMYENGEIIFETKSGIKHVNKDSIDLDLSLILNCNKANWSDSYITTMINDQPNFKFWWKDKTINIYGRFWLNTNYYPPPKEPVEKVSKRKMRKYKDELNQYNNYRVINKNIKAIPKELKAIYKLVNNVSSIDAPLWDPEVIEIFMWAYDNSPEIPVIWPEKWPNLNDTQTVKRRNDSYSIYLKGEDKDELLKLMSQMSERSAILINDRLMAAIIRYPFPHEYKWKNMQRVHNKEKQEKLY